MVEKIKLALERAYQERRDAGAFPAGKISNAPSVVNAPIEVLPPETGQNNGGYLLEETRYSVIDTDKLVHNRIITFDDTSKHAECFRLLRTQLLHYSNTAGVSAIGITSPAKEEGKSLVALNLAISMVRSSDVNVILVDADLSKPSIHKLLGLEVQYGLVDLLNGQVKLTDVLHRLNIPNLWVIPGRQERINLQDQNNANRVEELIGDFSVGKNTMIIADLPPVLGRDDTLVFASNLEGIVLVVEEGETKNAEISRSIGLLKQCNVLGTVLNKSTHTGVAA